MTEIIPNIYRLQLPLPNESLGYVNTYLVRGDSGHLLVDTGWNTDEAFNSLAEQLAEIGTRLEDISQLVVTHIHADHYGLAGRVKQLSKAKISLHYLEKDYIESRYVHMDELLQQIAQWLSINGVPANELSTLQRASVCMARFVTPVMPDITLHGGETIPIGSFNFKVLWTPGHTPGHISLYEPVKEILISGDYILPTITPNVSLHPQSGSNPLGDYLNSLNEVKQLKVNLILPGHEHPFRGLQSRIDEIIWHHKQRDLEILETVKRQAKTAYQIATEITWMSDTKGVGWQDLAPWNKRLAVLETLAHLESMRFGGKVDKLFKDSIIYYQAT